MVVEIDGSILEGGGQILRSAIAFSAVLGEPVTVTKIRANRKTPGLRPQHLHGILAIKKLSNAQVKGTHEGSSRIDFFPQNRQGGEIFVDIGTAGAITLVLQSVMIVAPFCEKQVAMKLIGGTNVAWSPPIDYLQTVLLPRLEQMGYLAVLEIIKRGYYPRGGGQVNATISPIAKLAPIQVSEVRGQPIITGISHCGSLPKHVAERQAKAASNILVETDYPVEKIQIEHNENTFSPGSGISLTAINNGFRILGTDALGRRGLKAEKVGENAAAALLRELATNAPVDRFQADMLVPYLALANGSSSISITTLTMHSITNVHVAEQFLDIKFNIHGKLDYPAQITVNGVGLEGPLASR
ncbi:MAG: RNA 3'-terminal phosphate cyclase [Promethearchaeota archaeon]